MEIVYSTPLDSGLPLASRMSGGPVHNPSTTPLTTIANTHASITNPSAAHRHLQAHLRSSRRHSVLASIRGSRSPCLTLGTAKKTDDHGEFMLEVRVEDPTRSVPSVRTDGLDHVGSSLGSSPSSLRPLPGRFDKSCCALRSGRA